jgi:hypothetical protein
VQGQIEQQGFTGTRTPMKKKEIKKSLLFPL